MIDSRAATPASPKPVLAFESVSKAFGATAAVSDVTASLAPGEIVAVVGPSGCGKSTLLRMASGLTSPTSGSLHLADRNIGYVFQDATLLPWRTVQRNLELFGELAGLPRQERRQRAADALALTGLTGFERHRPRQLSGGMRMRVSLARALTMRPKVFLLDEPFGALDEITRQRLNDELLQIHLAEKFAALFITHSVAEATYLASRVLVMSRRPGRIVADIPVPFGYPRTSDLRFDQAFVATTAEVSRALLEAAQ
jgi:NitT/TauT family transport system ATP-binding protein